MPPRGLCGPEESLGGKDRTDETQAGFLTFFFYLLIVDRRHAQAPPPPKKHDYGMLLSTIGFVLSMWEGQKISRKASEIIEKSMENQPKPKETNGFQRESSKQVQK